MCVQTVEQLTFFHGYYDQYQYLPLIITEATTRHVLMAWLRPRTLHPTRGGDDSLRQVMDRLWSRWPKTTIHMRGDADFGLPTSPGAHRDSHTYGLSFSGADLSRARGGGALLIWSWAGRPDRAGHCVRSRGRCRPSAVLFTCRPRHKSHKECSGS